MGSHKHVYNLFLLPIFFNIKIILFLV